MASPFSADADAAWTKDPNWIVPILWRSEFRNALAGSIRQRSLTPEEANIIANLGGHPGPKGIHGFDLGSSSTRFQIELLGL